MRRRRRSRPMAKKLTKIRIDEVSAVDSGAGRGVRVVMMKRAGKRYRFNEAGSLVPVGKFDTSDSLSRALEEVQQHREFRKAAAPLVGDQHMQTTETVDVNKAATAVIKKFDDHVAEFANRHNITRGAALLKIAASPDDAALWCSYREAQQVIGVPAAPTPEPAQVLVSEAYQKMAKKAAKLAKREGISEASAFSKVYASRPDLAAQDRAFRLGGRAA
jgi:hypothetical protein